MCICDFYFYFPFGKHSNIAFYKHKGGIAYAMNDVHGIWIKTKSHDAITIYREATRERENREKIM